MDRQIFWGKSLRQGCWEITELHKEITESNANKAWSLDMTLIFHNSTNLSSVRKYIHFLKWLFLEQNTLKI